MVEITRDSTEASIRVVDRSSKVGLVGNDMSNGGFLVLRENSGNKVGEVSEDLEDIMEAQLEALGAQAQAVQGGREVPVVGKLFKPGKNVFKSWRSGVNRDMSYA